MALAVFTLVRRLEAEHAASEWVQPIVMTAVCSGMLVAALAMLAFGVPV